MCFIITRAVKSITRITFIAGAVKWSNCVVAVPINVTFTVKTFIDILNKYFSILQFRSIKMAEIQTEISNSIITFFTLNFWTTNLITMGIIETQIYIFTCAIKAISVETLMASTIVRTFSICAVCIRMAIVTHFAFVDILK